jgi:hypothetical protein
MNDYLIPANSKKSQLILGFMTGIDLAIFLTGLGVTLFLLMIFRDLSLFMMILVLLPLLIAAFLVLPVPHYHNMLQLITNIITFFLGRRQYLWKGWCIQDGETERLE